MSLPTVLRSPTRRWPAGGSAAGVAAVSLIALAGCGQAATEVSAAGSGRPPGPAAAVGLTLCAHPAAVSRVHIVLIPALAQLQQPVQGSRKLISLTVTDPARARTLARVVCGLPRIPAGQVMCPVDIGGGYQLTFTAGGRRRSVVNVQATGCERVTGIGPVRWVARTPGFWTVLGKAAGIQAIRHTP